MSEVDDIFSAVLLEQALLGSVRRGDFRIALLVASAKRFGYPDVDDCLDLSTDLRDALLIRLDDEIRSGRIRVTPGKGITIREE